MVAMSLMQPVAKCLSPIVKTSSQRKTEGPATGAGSSPGLAAPWSVSNRPPRLLGPSPRPAAGGRSTCSGSRRGSAAPLTSALRRWPRSAAGRRRRGRGGAPGLRAALGRPREAERPRLGRSCAPRAPATAPRRRPQSQPARSKVANSRGADSLTRWCRPWPWALCRPRPSRALFAIPRPPVAEGSARPSKR